MIAPASPRAAFVRETPDTSAHVKIEYGFDPETGKRIRILRDAPTPKSFWSYQAPDTPSLESALAKGRIAASTTQAQWESLSPGMRREICR